MCDCIDSLAHGISHAERLGRLWKERLWLSLPHDLDLANTMKTTLFPQLDKVVQDTHDELWWPKVEGAR